MLYYTIYIYVTNAIITRAMGDGYLKVNISSSVLYMYTNCIVHICISYYEVPCYYCYYYSYLTHYILIYTKYYVVYMYILYK